MVFSVIKFMNKIPRVGIDVDGVLRDFRLRLRSVYLGVYPDHNVPALHEWTSFDLHLYFPIGEEVYDFFTLKNPREIYLGADPYQGAVEFMKELYGFTELSIVTAPINDNTKKFTERWLELNQMPYHELVFSNDKTDYKGDYLLDDSEGVLKRVKKTGNAIPVCFRQLWNQTWSTDPIVNSYQEFLHLVRNGKRL